MHPVIGSTMGAAMHALICRQWGTVDQLQFGKMAPPIPAANQILMDVHATAVNYADAIMVAGRYQTKPALPFAPGLEAAGVVRACGAAITRFRPGDRVMAFLNYGGMAEQAVADESDAWAIPPGMSMRDAGAFPIAYTSSDVALRWQGRLVPGETLLVLGAAGGVGLTAVEIGKAMGARVIACASTAERLAAARDRGADATINYSAEDLKARVAALTKEEGADVCFDPVGGALFDAALSSLAWGGRYLHVGFVGGVPQVPANRLLVKNRSALGSSLRYFRWRARDKLERSMSALLEWYQQGKLRPLVTHEWPLARGVEALELLTERKAYGRVLLLPLVP
jgi:NADPH2:quinone reductase